MSESCPAALRTATHVVVGAVAAALMNGAAWLTTRRAPAASEPIGYADAALPAAVLDVVDDGAAPTPTAPLDAGAGRDADAQRAAARRDVRPPRRTSPTMLDADVLAPPPVPVVIAQGATEPAPVAADAYTATALLRDCQPTICGCGLVDGAALVFVFGPDGKLAFVEGAVGSLVQQCVRDVVNRALRLAPSPVTRRIPFPLRCPPPRRY